uniref:SERTA domain containing 4 n=1 Tax=Neogobius melanostomus TaxID=47308 RepID=A0A8C6U0X5_9GOBI
MTLVLSMNPFLDPEGDPPLSTYRQIWQSERCTKSCLTNPSLPCSSEESFTRGTCTHLDPHCRRVPDPVSLSRIAYFKRKFIDDEDEALSGSGLTVAPVLEERAHVLRLSVEKMRFIDDPEAFLRRSVLVNNLLRRLRAEILLQSTDWCFPPNPDLPAPQAGPPQRKRYRLMRGQDFLRPDCAQTCCCIYAAAAAGHYLHLPFSMYDAALSTCPTTSHSSTLFQLANHSKLSFTLDIEDHDEEDEDGEEEEEHEEEEEGDSREQAGTSHSLMNKSSSKRTRTAEGLKQAHTRTEEDSSMRDSREEEEEEDEEEEGAASPWDSDSSEKELHKVGFWQRRAHRQ